jgi:hypothetical protein
MSGDSAVMRGDNELVLGKTAALSRSNAEMPAGSAARGSYFGFCIRSSMRGARASR